MPLAPLLTDTVVSLLGLHQQGFSSASVLGRPSVFMTHTYHYLPEGNEITTRKSNPERRSLIVDEDAELQLPGGGYLGGSFIALGKAGWGWTPASFNLEGYPGETGFFRITGKGISGPFCATSSFTNHGRGKDSVKVEERERPGIIMLRAGHYSCVTSNGH